MSKKNNKEGICMLTSAEKRKIRRYATLHKSMIGICVMIGFSPIFALAMIIFDAIVLEREHLSPILGSVVMIGPTIFYLPVALYVCFGLLHSLRHSTQWFNIVQKVAASNGITEASVFIRRLWQRGHKSSRRPSNADKR